MGERAVAGGVVVRRAEDSDFPGVAGLLRECHLPVDGLREALSGALVASISGEIVGCVAIELYDGAALLRSLAVSPRARNLGLGADLTDRALERARSLGARDVYLLTETADDFFTRFGFTVEDRSKAPLALQDSIEFRSACPKSARMMRARVTQ
jgi:N-acetylglutamate synthase-like GNAT family acetyltransferase